MPGLMLSGGTAFAPPSTVTSATAAAHRRLRPSSSGQGCADGPVSPIYAIRVLETTTHCQSVKTPPHTLGASTGDKDLAKVGQNLQELRTTSGSATTPSPAHGSRACALGPRPRHTR